MKISLIGLILILSLPALAVRTRNIMGGFAEFQLGIQLGNSTSNSANDSLDSKGSLHGYGWGVKLGTQILSTVQLTVDYFSSKMKNSDQNSNFSTTEWGGSLAIAVENWRIVGGPILYSNLKESDLKPGQGYKAGLSYYVYDNLAISLEYRKVTFPEAEIASTKFNNDYNATMLILSIPISEGGALNTRSSGSESNFWSF